MPELLAAIGAVSGTDRILEHSLTYALIEIADPEGTSKGLESTDLRTKRLVLTALDQMEGGRLEPLRGGRIVDRE